MSDLRPLTNEEHAAVLEYALAHGADWKDELNADWMNARTTGILQALRNSHGPSWLADYSIADWPRALFSAETTLAHAPIPRLAALACRKLIFAYVENPEQVRWEDIQDALAVAIEAFGLPANFIEMARAVAPD